MFSEYPHSDAKKQTNVAFLSSVDADTLFLQPRIPFHSKCVDAISLLFVSIMLGFVVESLEDDGGAT
jgi:hypothetical protein